MIGGEAINFYLSKENKLDTADYDLKFVVNPEFIKKDEDLRRANALRLRIVRSLMHCLGSIKTPSKYHDIYPKLAILIQQQPRFVYIDDNKLFVVDPRTGGERFFHYNFNKVFKILLYYRYGTKRSQLKYLELVNLSLFYQLREEGGYSFFAADIYDTFLKSPFNKKMPIPFVVRNEIRIPTLPFLLFDNFRMALISLDNLSLSGKDPELVEKWKDKLSRYWIKVKKMNEALRRNNSKDDLNQLTRAMKHTFELYEPLAYVNSICYHTGRIYTSQMQKKPECNPTYVKKLDDFHHSYQNVATIVSQLKY